MTNKIEIGQKTETLETEVKIFADSLPYWAKFLAERKLSGSEISDIEIYDMFCEKDKMIISKDK